jgi:hypothetical protein
MVRSITPDRTDMPGMNEGWVITVQLLTNGEAFDSIMGGFDGQGFEPGRGSQGNFRNPAGYEERLTRVLVCRAGSIPCRIASTAYSSPRVTLSIML